MIHLTIQQLSSYIDGELAESSAGLARQHLSSCESCAAKLSQLEAQGVALASALSSHPDDAFFERLTHGIEERIRSPRPKSPASVPDPASPEPAVTVGGTTPVRPDAASLAAPAAAPTMPRHNARGRATRGRSFRRGSWAAAAAIGVPIAIIAVSVGVMRTRVGWMVPRHASQEARNTDPAHPGVTSAPQETAQAAAVQIPTGVSALAPVSGTRPDLNSVARGHPQAEADPGSDSGAEAVSVENSATGSDAAQESDFVPIPIRADDALAASPNGGSSPAADPFAHLNAGARDAVRSAQRQSDKAVNDLSAEGFEASAADWQRALPLLGGDAYLAASLGLAEARFHAWQLAPTAERAARARASAGAYLDLAPAGPERDKASGWLSRLEEAGFR